MSLSESNNHGPKPLGSYGIDAPWVPWLWVGYAALFATLSVFASTVWDAWLVAVLYALLTAVSVAAAILYLHATVRGKFLLWRELLASLPTAGEPRRILDLGCGRAAVAIMAAQQFPDANVTGIDLWRSIDQSSNSIESARNNAEQNAVADRIRFDTGDMTALPYPDASFDLITASLSIHNIPSRAGRERAVEEALRVLAPGGRLVIVDIRRTKDYRGALARLGLDVGARQPLGWRGWWSGPWMATTALQAGRPA